MHGETGVEVTGVGGHFFTEPSRLGEDLGIVVQFELGHGEPGIGPAEFVDLPPVAVALDQMAGLFDKAASAEGQHVVRLTGRDFVFELGAPDPLAPAFDREPSALAVGADAHRVAAVDGEVALAQRVAGGGQAAPAVIGDEKLAFDFHPHGKGSVHAGGPAGQSGRGCELVRRAPAGQSRG